MTFPSPSGEKAFWRGTHRARPPGETVAGALELAPLMGVTRVANITGLDRIGIPVVSVVRPNARSISVSQGKGFDLDSAKASGLMEAIEGYHAENVAHPLRHQSAREMEAAFPTVDLSRLPLLGDRQVDLDQKLLWIEGSTIPAGDAVWLPYDVVHTDFTNDALAHDPSFFMSSNGVASGNHHAEAWNHALYEVIERDATTLWELRTSPTAGADPTRIDLSTIDDPDCLEVLDRFARTRVQVIVRDVTSDVGVPCFRCTIGERPGASLHLRAPTTGSGCHADRSIALMRALLEAAQSRLTMIAGVRDDLPARAFDASVIHAAAVAFDARVREPDTKDFAAVPHHPGDTFEGDLAWVVQRLATAGCGTPIGVDLTKPEFGVPVVRVVVPGLEAMCTAPGYVPGARALCVLREGRAVPQ